MEDGVKVQFDKNVVEEAMSYCLSRQFGVPIAFRLEKKEEKSAEKNKTA